MPPESVIESVPVPTILIVDDDASQRSLLSSFLKKQGFEILTADSGEEALKTLNARSLNLMISDVRMPGISGLETLRRARRERALLPVLLVTAYADIREAVDAMRDGAVNYLSKPIDLDELLASVRQALGLSSSLTPTFHADRVLPPYVIAESPLMQALFRDAALIADSESRVLITGESGVGKEVLADVIHGWGRRAQGPLVKVNCAALPETLLESELFGHEKGAFTGATAQRIGRFEYASGGTIFLDEIGEMTPPLQAKLLRVIQDGRFQRLGSNKEIFSNARILAASNKNLEEAVRKGMFREDLYYRLNVVELSIPPLRERQEDILPLSMRFAEEFSSGRARISASVSTILQRYAWPGNVRELRNAMERASLLSCGGIVLPEHLPTKLRAQALDAAEPLAGEESRRLDRIEQQTVLEALSEHGFNRSETARVLGISRRALIYKLQRLREQGFSVDRP